MDSRSDLATGRSDGSATLLTLDVRRGPDLDATAQIAAEAIERAAPYVSRHPYLTSLAARSGGPLTVVVHVVSDTVFDEWAEIDREALGFFAVANRIEADWEEDGDSLRVRVEYDLPEGFEVYVVADRMAELVDPDSVHAAGDLDAWLMTFPHEVLHAVQWAVTTGGRTPLEVFDGGFGGMDGEEGIRAALAAADAALGEDDIEEACHFIVGGLPSGVVEQALSGLSAARAAPGPR
jgi:hypothetical protein